MSTSTSTSTDPVTPATIDPADKSMDEIVALCKRRGFVFPASEIYGGLNGFWDFGPLGTELKNNLRDAWWREMVTSPPPGQDGHPLSIVGLDSAIIQNPRVWEASGHVGGFNDPMVDCRESKARYRHDLLFVYRHPDDETLPMFAFLEGEPEQGSQEDRQEGSSRAPIRTRSTSSR